MTAPGAAASEDATVRIEAAFLDGFKRGRRFGVWVEPPAGVPVRGAILCIQPFCDEATLARRVLAAQARRLAPRGWTTLIFDLHATGDSDGDTDDATLGQWRHDLLRARQLARERAPGRFVVWGTRMGTLLAAELVRGQDQGASAVVFWQPSATGTALIDPLLKLADVGALARQGAEEKTIRRDDRSAAQSAAQSADRSVDRSADRSGGQSPGRILLAGYLLRRDLVDGLAALALDPKPPDPQTTPCPVLMLGIQRVLPPNGKVPKTLADLAQRWLEAGRPPTLRAIQGEPFWSSLEPSMPLAAFEAMEDFLDAVAGVGGVGGVEGGTGATGAR